MKVILGIGVCVGGLIVWTAPLVASLTRVHPTAVSLGVIMGGVIIMSGVALICSPNHPIKVPYFDKRP
jgi:drug/metabolite transporter (DMT)-like permease